ncbi:hypothetical protein MNBD_GAMMA08-815 [hydrothermal vent metagenome]|uniref:Uncharacterized protein n=1 Tax=hydrothermal vent metagenome TaxID=652676 RepID=A0A3B0WUU1_9ZZZZ
MANTTKKTDDVTELVKVGGELLPMPPKEKTRRSPCEIDQLYIQAYLNAPHRGKASAFRTATGDMSPYARQRGSELHARLAPEINEILKEKMLGITSFGLDTLIHLAENSDNDAVRGSAATQLLNAGLKICPANLEATKPKTREQLHKEITAVKERLKAIGVSV